jgi:hypothetical protein
MAGFYTQIMILLKPQVKDPTVSTAVKKALTLFMLP